MGKETNYKALCLVNEKGNDKGIDSSFEIRFMRVESSKLACVFSSFLFGCFERISKLICNFSKFFYVFFCFLMRGNFCKQS